MESRRPAFLDGTNAGLLAAIVAVPLLALVVWVGPLHGFVRRAAEEQERQSAEIEHLVEKKRALTPVAPSERERVRAALAEFEADVTSLGDHPNARLVQAMADLLERAGVREVRVTLPPPIPEEEPRAPLVVAALDGTSAIALVPNSVHVALRSDFTGLRAALDALGDPGRTIQVEAADFVRDGASVKATLEITYWSRERVP